MKTCGCPWVCRYFPRVAWYDEAWLLVLSRWSACRYCYARGVLSCFLLLHPLLTLFFLPDFHHTITSVEGWMAWDYSYHYNPAVVVCLVCHQEKHWMTLTLCLLSMGTCAFLINSKPIVRWTAKVHITWNSDRYRRIYRA